MIYCFISDPITKVNEDSGFIMTMETMSLLKDREKWWEGKKWDSEKEERKLRNGRKEQKSKGRNR